jgi:membrane protease YdiL (CAAX protease family)
MSASVRTWLSPTAARSDWSSTSWEPIGEHAATPRIDRVFASALPPVILLVAAAAVESLRVPVLVLLLVGFLAAVLPRRSRGEQPQPHVLAYGACLVLALNLGWGGVPLSAIIGIGTACVDRLAPFASLRVLGALLVLATLWLVLRLVRARPSDIGLSWPSRRWLVASVVAVAVVGAGAGLLGPRLAEPFFGPIAPPTAELGALVPAIVFALANATMEEVAYRGALLRWLTPSAGVVNALALQAFVFGLAHGVGTDFIGSPLPVMAATAAAGLALGALALRTRSLLLPIAIHVALDIPVFYGKVCLGT